MVQEALATAREIEDSRSPLGHWAQLLRR
jgi:hypothetical protein